MAGLGGPEDLEDPGGGEDLEGRGVGEVDITGPAGQVSTPTQRGAFANGAWKERCRIDITGWCALFRSGGPRLA